MKKVILFTLFLLIRTNAIANLEIVSELEIPDGKILLKREFDFNNERKNPDGSLFYKNKVVIEVHYQGKKQSKELLSNLYMHKNTSWSGMAPSMLFDPNKNVVTVFVNGKKIE